MAIKLESENYSELMSYLQNFLPQNAMVSKNIVYYSKGMFIMIFYKTAFTFETSKKLVLQKNYYLCNIAFVLVSSFA